jgi:lipopolysaccharide biosynthesis glycosyltransferase
MSQLLPKSIWIGWDPREAAAFAVARHSIRRHLTQAIPIFGLVLDYLRASGLYSRPMEWKQSAADKPIMWDTISDAPMATEHACARFLVPYLAKSGWALFVDGDTLFRGNVGHLFEQLDESKAVYCVHHRHEPQPGMKMDGQNQTKYSRKNWSSFLVFNCDHPSNKALTLELINTVPGRDLHRFCWLKDSEIGELGPEWNFLVGHTDPSVEPKVVHFTEGLPDMPGYEAQAYANEWREARNSWAQGALS